MNRPAQLDARGRRLRAALAATLVAYDAPEVQLVRDWLDSWSLPHNPYVGVLAEAVARHVSPEAGASMRAPCAFGDIEALRTSIREGGFRESRIRIAVRLLRMQRVEEFMLGQLAATPLAGAVAALAVSAREALLSDISEALRAYRDDEGVAVPLEAHVVVAQA